MDEPEARLILQSFRPGTEDEQDPHFAEALREVERTPELARWLEKEQAFDRVVAAKLSTLPAPFGLKTRLLAQAGPPPRRFSWSLATALAAVAALLFLVAQIVSLFRPNAPSSGTLGNYAREMVSFVRIPPSLDLESHDLGVIEGWLQPRHRSSVKVPPTLAELRALGCRILSFRGHNVVLVCFQRQDSRMAHLFIVDRSALPDLQPGREPVFTRSGEWMTATWAEGDQVYMIAVQGNESAAKKFLPQT
jgi:hypothetical protein